VEVVEAVTCYGLYKSNCCVGGYVITCGTWEKLWYSIVVRGNLLLVACYL
jgi:hypothetical protein